MVHSESLKNFSYVAVGNVIGAVFQAAFYILFATLLEPEEYGIIVFIIALSGTFSVISRFGLPFTAVVYQAKGNYILANQATVLVVITTTVASLILLPIDQYAALLCLTTSFFVINTQNILGDKKYKKYLWVYVIKSVLIITLPISLYFFFEIPGILVGMALGNIFASPHFFKNLSKKINMFRELRENSKVLIHNFTVDVSSSLARSIDKLVIVPLYGFVPVAIYQFNLQIMLAVSILPIALYQFLLSEESSGKNHPKIKYLVLVTTVIIALLVIILSPYVIDRFFPKFSEGILGLQVIIITLIPIALNSILNAKFQSIESTKVGFPAIIKIISLLALIAILGGPFGIIGLSIAVLASACLETVLLTILYRKLKNYKTS